MTDVQQTPFNAEQSTGTISPFGAHVMSWGLTGERPVLWMSAKAVLDGSRPIRGGIPICLPWFGDAASSPAAPGADASAHGFVRTSKWTRFEDPEADPSTVMFEYRHHRLDFDGVFPHSFTALYSVSAGPELTVSLQVANKDDHPFVFEEALHTYFGVGDSKDATITGLEGASYIDKNRGGRERTQVGEVMFTGPVDRVYDSTSPVTLIDPRWLRRITVDKQGSATTVVWNPWVEAARATSDMGDSEWLDFVCIETANVGDNAILLEPNRVHTMSMTVRIEYFL